MRSVPTFQKESFRLLTQSLIRTPHEYSQRQSKLDCPSLATSEQLQVTGFVTFNPESKMLAGCPEYLFQLTLQLNLVALGLAMIQYYRYVSSTFQVLHMLCLFPKSVRHTYVLVPYC